MKLKPYFDLPFKPKSQFMRTISPRIQFLITAHVIRLIPRHFHLESFIICYCFQTRPWSLYPHLLAVVQPWYYSAFQRISGWSSSHVRVLWTYLCRIWEHFILINIIHALVHSLGLCSCNPIPQSLAFTARQTNNPTPHRIAELSKVERHEKFVTVVEGTCEESIKESIR